MSLKSRVDKLEKAVGIEDPVQGARDLVQFSIDYGILPADIDFEAAVKACAEEGLSMGKIIREIQNKSQGLPKLPCFQEDID